MSQRTPLIIYGAAGRMGRMILQSADPSTQPFDIVGAIEGPGNPLLGQPVASLLPGMQSDVLISADPPASAPEGSVVINFSLPEPTLDQLIWAQSAGVASVVGTTGFSPAQREKIQRIAKSVPVLLAPNMSVGVNVLYRLVAEAVRLLGDSYDIEITEMHHRFKKDAPSGTARALLETVLDARGESAETADIHHGREGIVGERRKGEIGMHCLRGGDVVGDHTVTLAALGERVELTHKASSRETFARGAVRAAAWLSGQPAGMYSMKDVLGL